MPRLTPEEVRHVAWLARLRLSPDEERRMTEALNVMLDHFQKLQALDTTGVPPTSHAVPMANRFREDEQRPSLPRDDVLHEAPETVDAFFVVPRIVEG